MQVTRRKTEEIELKDVRTTKFLNVAYTNGFKIIGVVIDLIQYYSLTMRFTLRQFLFVA